MEERVLLSFNGGVGRGVFYGFDDSSSEPVIDIVEFLVPLLTPSTSMLSVNPSIVLFEGL
jgi:hypothetical protein